ncbi:MAG: hypothetical protein WDA53_04275 [Bacillota bacterium]
MEAGVEVTVNQLGKAKELQNRTGRILLGIAVLVFLVGLGFWIKQFTTGFGGYSAQYAWGLFIAAFFTAAAGGAGVLILGSIIHFFSKPGGNYLKLYYMGAFALFVTAGFFIMADLGAPLNVFKLVFTSNFAAPMIADFWLMVACALVSLFMVFLKGEKRILSLVGLICALALIIVQSWLISSTNIQQLWGITMGAGSAFLQVAILAFALLLLIGQETKNGKLALAAVLLFFLAVSLTDLVTGLSVSGRLGLQWLAVSKSIVFWLGIILGVVAPLLLLLANLAANYKSSSVVVSILSILGVFLTKLSYVWCSQAVPAIDAGPLTSPSFHLEEIIIVLGFTAVGVIIYQCLKLYKGGTQL